MPLSRAIGLFILSYLSESQVKGLFHERGGRHMVTVYVALRGQKAYWGTAWFPSGIVYELLLLAECHAAFGTLPSTLTWVDQSPVNQRVT
jgi:hypothetical protein